MGCFRGGALAWTALIFAADYRWAAKLNMNPRYDLTLPLADESAEKTAKTDTPALT